MSELSNSELELTKYRILAVALITVIVVSFAAVVFTIYNNNSNRPQQTTLKQVFNDDGTLKSQTINGPEEVTSTTP